MYFISFQHEGNNILNMTFKQLTVYFNMHVITLNSVELFFLLRGRVHPPPPPPVTWNVEPQNRDPPPSIVLSDTSRTATDEEGAEPMMMRTN